MAQTKAKRHPDDRGGDTGEERPSDPAAVAEKAWNATKEEQDPYWGAIPNAEFKSKMIFACERVWVTGVALTNFEIKCKALITGVDVVLPDEVKEAREGEDAPNAVVAIEPLPPLPFTPGEAPPKPVPDPHEERSFTADGTAILKVDEFNTSADIIGVRIANIEFPVPPFVPVPPDILQATDQGAVWANGENVLVNAFWADMQEPAE